MEINQGMGERVIRGLVGAVLIGLGVFAVRGVVGIIVGLIGAVVLFSGFVGFCHVYKVFHINTSKKAQGGGRT